MVGLEVRVGRLLPLPHDVTTDDRGVVRRHRGWGKGQHRGRGRWREASRGVSVSGEGGGCDGRMGGEQTTVHVWGMGRCGLAGGEGKRGFLTGETGRGHDAHIWTPTVHSYGVVVDLVFMHIKVLRLDPNRRLLPLPWPPPPSVVDSGRCWGEDTTLPSTISKTIETEGEKAKTKGTTNNAGITISRSRRSLPNMLGREGDNFCQRPEDLEGNRDDPRCLHW